MVRPSSVQVVVKTPSSTEQDFRLEVSLAGTKVRDVKLLLQEQHPEHPAPDTQRLIFAGKLLTDDAPLDSDVLKQARRHTSLTQHAAARRLAQGTELPPEPAPASLP